MKRDSQKKLIVFTIALNEAEKIGTVLDKTPKFIDGISEIIQIVIDDGSTDKTVEIAREHGAEVYTNLKQKRLAYSFQKAIRIALEHGANIAVGIDGDMQFDPAEIHKLVEPIVNGTADFVIGNRFANPKTGQQRKPKHMSISKYYGNLLGTKIVSILSNQHFDDVTCGFRAYSRKAMLALNINAQYTYTQESFQVLARKKLNITSVPVHIEYFPNRESRVVTNFVKFLVGSGISILKAFRDHSPLKFFTWMGFIPAIAGLMCALFTLIHWVLHGSITPYKSIGIIGLYLISVGLFTWIIGVMADILDRVQNNQEKILELLKEIRFPFEQTTISSTHTNSLTPKTKKSLRDK